MVISSQPLVDPAPEMVTHVLEKESDLLVMVKNSTIKEADVAFRILSK